MRTTIYYTDISAFRDEPLFERLYRSLPPCRQEKIDRLKPEGERCRSLGAGLLLKHACEEYGLAGEDGFLDRNEYGKPFFVNRPGLHFSLSHSGDWAMCVLSPFTAGCDIEKIRPFHQAVPKRVFTGEERRLLSEEGKQGRGEKTFCRLWTLKESFLKATGKGFAFPAEDCSFSFGSGEIIFSLRGEKNDSYRFFEWENLPGYCAAACLHSGEAELPEAVFVSFCG